MSRRIFSLLLALGLILAPLPSGAELNYQLVELTNMTGGLNDAFSSLDIKPSEASAIQNIIFPRTINGAFAKRPGYTRVNSTALGAAVICTGVGMYKQRDQTRYLVSLWDDDKIRKMDYAVGGDPDGTWDDITGALSFLIGQDNHADFAVAENTLIIEEELGTTAPYQWTGTGNATALGGGSPNAKYVEYHRRILFAAGNDAQPSRLYFSNLGDIFTWTGTDFIDIQTDGSDGVIRSLKAGLDGLYIWKDSAIWRLTGNSRDEFFLERMVQGVGTIANGSVAVVNSPTDNNQLFAFVTQKGDIALYDGGIEVKIISNRINASFPNSLSYARIDETVGTAYEFTYMVSASLSGSGTHNTLFMFDLLHNAWTVFDGMAANAVGTFENGNGKELFTFGDYTGRANQWDITDTTTLNDPGTTAIEAFYETGWLMPQGTGLLKDLRKVRVFANQEGTGQTLDLTVRTDFSSSGTTYSISLAGSGALWDTAIYDTSRYADLDVTIAEAEPNVGENAFLLRFENSRASERFRVRRVQLLIEPKGRM